MSSVARDSTAHFKSCKKKKKETYFKVIQDLTLGKLAYLQISQFIFIHFFIQQIFVKYLLDTSVHQGLLCLLNDNETIRFHFV